MRFVNLTPGFISVPFEDIINNTWIGAKRKVLNEKVNKKWCETPLTAINIYEENNFLITHGKRKTFSRISTSMRTLINAQNDDKSKQTR